MLTGILAAVLVAGMVIGNLILWRYEIQFAAELDTVTTPTGQRYDILVHRDGVVLYTRREARWNTLSVFPTIVALIRRWRRGTWRWAVTVRRSRFHGYPNLLHEVVDDEDTARRRARQVAQRLKDGERLWPAEWEF